jgi:hypothetical protein
MAKHHDDQKYKIIYPSLSLDDVSELNEKINTWFVEHRDNDELLKTLNDSYDDYHSKSRTNRSFTTGFVIAMLGLSFFLLQAVHLPIERAGLPIIISIGIVVSAILIESRLRVIYSQREFDIRVSADYKIKHNCSRNPLEFTMYDIPAKAVTLYDFSAMKRVHMYTDLINTLLWFKSQNCEYVCDLNLEEKTVTVAPIFDDGTHPIDMTFDKDTVSVYADMQGVYTIDFTPLEKYIKRDVEALV